MSTARSRQEAAQAIENHLREHMRIRLGPNAAAEAAQGGPVRLSGSEAEYAAYLALEALEQAGLVVVGRCVCGQPLGTCTCGDPRCWHCDSPGDECTPAEPHGTWRARAEAAQRMLDATRTELHTERVEHGAAVARLARLAAAVEAVLAHKLDGGEAPAELARVHREVSRSIDRPEPGTPAEGSAQARE